MLSCVSSLVLQLDSSRSLLAAMASAIVVSTQHTVVWLSNLPVRPAPRQGQPRGNRVRAIPRRCIRIQFRVRRVRSGATARKAGLAAGSRVALARSCLQGFMDAVGDILEQGGQRLQTKEEIKTLAA